MTRIFRFVLLFGIVAFTFGCAREVSEAPNQEQMIGAAKELDQTIVAAINKGDVDAVMATYWNSPDLVVYMPDALELRGWQTVKDAFAQSFAKTPGTRLELLDTNYHVAGDVVIGYGRFRMTVPSQSGPPTEILGRYTDVKTQRDGKWVYIVDHASAPLPPPPAPPAAAK